MLGTIPCVTEMVPLPVTQGIVRTEAVFTENFLGHYLTFTRRTEDSY